MHSSAIALLGDVFPRRAMPMRVCVLALLSPYHPATSIHSPANLTGMYFRILFIIRPHYSMDPYLHILLHTLFLGLAQPHLATYIASHFFAFYQIMRFPLYFPSHYVYT